MQQELTELQYHREVLEMLRKDCEAIRRGRRLELVPLVVKWEAIFNQKLEEVDRKIADLKKALSKPANKN